MYLSVFLKYGFVVYFFSRVYCGTPFGCHLKHILFYDISDGFTQPQLDTIYSLMRHIENETCVRWLHHSKVGGDTLPRITFIHRETTDDLIGADCYTRGFYQTGSAEIHLTKNCFPSSVLHEIMHAMGFKHEHQRKNRNCYVSIAPHAVSKDYYLIRDIPEWMEQFPYDKMSAMHYAFDHDMQCVKKIKGDTCPLGNDGKHLSPLDIWKIKYKYCEYPHYCAIYPDRCKETKQFEDLLNCTVDYFQLSTGVNFSV